MMKRLPLLLPLLLVLSSPALSQERQRSSANCVSAQPWRGAPEDDRYYINEDSRLLEFQGPVYDDENGPVASATAEFQARFNGLVPGRAYMLTFSLQIGQRGEEDVYILTAQGLRGASGALTIETRRRRQVREPVIARAASAAVTLTTTGNGKMWAFASRPQLCPGRR